MTMIWGVDSAYERQKPNFMRPYQGSRRYNFDIIADLAGMTPRFWGRYIIGSANIRLDDDEIQFLHEEKHCKILPIVTGLRRSLEHGGFDAGRRAAERAIDRARELNIPNTVRIYADLEQWTFIRAEWIQGWWTTMSASPHTAGAGGIYGRPNVTMYESDEDSHFATGIEFPQPRSAAARSRYDSEQIGRQVVASRWGPVATQAATMPGPHGETSLADRELDELMVGTSSGAMALSRRHWSNEPRTLNEDPPGRGPDAVMPRQFSPSRLVGGGMSTVIWQYRFSCYRVGGRVGLVDLDVATEEAFAEMW